MGARRSGARAARLAAGLVGAAVAGCGDRVGSPPAAPPPPAAAKVEAAGPDAPAPARDGRRVYTVRGVVKAVHADRGEVTIAHEAIPGFMAAMVMPFELKRREAFVDLEPGDRVEGPLAVEYRAGQVDRYELTDLTVTGAEPPAPPPPLARPAPLAVGAEVPDFAVTTQDGATLRLGDLRGKVVALTFIYTRCPLPDFCPAADAKFADLLRRVSVSAARAERVALLSISFDPEHDTPEVLRAHARRRGAKPPWSFAVADPAELARVGPLLGLDYYPERDQFAHNLITAVIGPDGRLARLETTRRWDPAEVYRTILDLIPDRAGR